MRDNLETLVGAVDDGALAFKLPKHARRELDGYLECGLLCRGFARLRCAKCPESLTVAFSCKSRGFCPSCMGRRMCATAAHLIDDVLPEVALRQWVLTFPFAWRVRLAHDGALLSTLTRLFVETVSKLYAARIGDGAKTGGITVVQRTSSDLRLNPHLRVVFLDGAYRERADELVFRELPRLTAQDVAGVLEAALRRIERHLRRRGVLPASDDVVDADRDAGADQEASLAASAVSGRTPPAGPSWQRGLPQLVGKSLALDKHLCASMDGFTLHAATRAGAADAQGREALLRYVLRPAIAQERVEQRPDGYALTARPWRVSVWSTPLPGFALLRSVRAHHAWPTSPMVVPSAAMASPVCTISPRAPVAHAPTPPTSRAWHLSVSVRLDPSTATNTRFSREHRATVAPKTASPSDLDDTASLESSR